MSPGRNRRSRPVLRLARGEGWAPCAPLDGGAWEPSGVRSSERLATVLPPRHRGKGNRVIRAAAPHLHLSIHLPAPAFLVFRVGAPGTTFIASGPQLPGRRSPHVPLGENEAPWTSDGRLPVPPRDSLGE